MLKLTGRGRLGLQHLLLGVSMLTGWAIERTTGKLHTGNTPEASAQREVAGQTNIQSHVVNAAGGEDGKNSNR